MTMFHGTTLYAVHSRDVGTFGGRAARATIKVYDTRDCGTPRVTISGSIVPAALDMLRDSKKAGRDAVQAYLAGAIEARANLTDQERSDLACDRAASRSFIYRERH